MRYKILIFILLSNISLAAHAIKSTTNSVTAGDRYESCFNNATWVVPQQTLLAYLYDNGNITPVNDQTVWVISTYNKGYFAGQSYTAIDVSTLSQRYLIGSITAEGRVFITFYSGISTSTDLVTGIGTLNVKSSGQCAFIMQMNSGQNGVSGLTHGSFMVPANPGDALYNNLPGTNNMSVPQFLAQF